ncbi:MAG: zinc-ribbon domain-containing protein [Lachnospiraceae bacterium]|nr:zinc-ribbon domain-containing protein [Lachnospiraceae bacterium]
MYCPKCGNNIADGSTNFCPVCGYALNNAQQSGFNLASEQPQQSNINNSQLGGGYQQSMYNPQSGGGYQQPMYNSQPNGGYSQPPKQNTGLIIGIIIGAVVLIAAIVVFLIFFVFKKDDTGNTGNDDSTGAQTVESTQNNTLPDDIDTSEDDLPDDTDTPDDDSDDIAMGTYSISSMRLEGSEFGYSDIDSMGYGEMTLRVEHDYIYFKQTTDGYDVPYYYTDSDGTGKMWNSVEEYTIYYTDDSITIDFASSEDFSEYTEYTMTFTK